MHLNCEVSPFPAFPSLTSSRAKGKFSRRRVRLFGRMNHIILPPNRAPPSINFLPHKRGFRRRRNRFKQRHAIAHTRSASRLQLLPPSLDSTSYLCRNAHPSVDCCRDRRMVKALFDAAPPKLDPTPSRTPPPQLTLVPAMPRGGVKRLSDENCGDAFG
ncbi:hypothetical protein IE53DRAFT_15415 [Violaceomyces palustris]|uniref:Uncharacterized protein n=1 Tax=Violaceomyces palustris TaxID=1673888 RepID=A0ACD0P241_9BASI|nr:hypothetical protein IE53DRAFT_15415 [Violaceomyces palustris]